MYKRRWLFTENRAEAIRHTRLVLRAISGAYRLPGAAVGAALIGSVRVGDCPVREPCVCKSTFSQHAMHRPSGKLFT